MERNYIIKTLFNNYTKRFLPKIFLSVFFSVCVAGSTSAIAWLLDPAIEKIFINKDQSLLLLIPLLIILAFATKGISLYLAKFLMINVAEEVKKKIQMNMLSSFIKADTEYIENKHTGKYISAEVGLKLFKANPTIKRGHLVGGFIADWWEIKSRNDNPEKRWPGYIDCYYGFWSNSIESWPSINSASIPPKMPLGPKNYMMNKFRT